MVSTNTDYNRNSESNKTKISGVPENSAPANSERTFRDCEFHLLERGSATSTTCKQVSTIGSHQFLSTNMMTRLKGQKWHHFFDYEKVLKQLRYIEKINIKKLDMRIQACRSDKAAASTAVAVNTLNSSQAAQVMKHVQRLNGNDMQYYGLAPKQEALEIVICSVCSGTYTKMGFNNHMIQQHTNIWSTVPNRIIPMPADGTVKSPIDSQDQRLEDLERIELVGISSDSSATVSTTMSSSSSLSLASSIFGSTTRAVKSYRSNNSIGSSCARFRSKLTKQHKQMSTSTTLTNSPILSPLSTGATSAELPLSISNSSKSVSKKSMSSLVNPTTTPTLFSTASTFVNVSVKVLPTVERATDMHSSNNTPTIFGITSTFSHLSNSSTSSSSTSPTSPTSPKTSSLSTKSPPALTFPTLLFTEASRSATAQFEIVSSSTAYYLKSNTKALRSTEFDPDSLEKTDDSATTTSISDIKDLTTSPVALYSAGLMPTNGSPPNNNVPNTIADQALKQISGIESISSTPALKLLSEESYEKSKNNDIIKNDNSLASGSIISSSTDIIQSKPITELHEYHTKKLNYNSESLQLANISTTGTGSSITEVNINSYSDLPPSTKNRPNSKINLEKMCGVSMEYRIPCTRPLTCTIHTLAAKRQVVGRSKPFDELLTHCAGKDSKGILPTQGIVALPSDKDLGRQNLLGSLSITENIPSAVMQNIPARKRNIVNNSFKNNLYTLKVMKSDLDKTAVHLNSNEKNDLQSQLPLYSNQKSKLEITYTTALDSSNTVPQIQKQVTANLCDERTLKHYPSNENSILAIDGIFDHATQLEMLDSKFVTEILSNADTDNNFEDLECSSSAQTRLQHSAAKRLRLDVDCVEKPEENENAFTCFNQMQLQNLVSEQSAICGQGIEPKSFTNYDEATQQMQQDVDIQYHKKIGTVSHHQDQITNEAVQLQQLLDKQCSFNNLDVLDQRQQQQQQQQQHQIDINASLHSSKEISDFSTEKICIRIGNNTYMSKLSNVSIDNKAIEPEMLKELNMDHESTGKIDWRCNVFNVLSLTDYGTEEITIDKSINLKSTSQENGAEHCKLPTEDELIFELTNSNKISIQQRKVIKKLLTQANFKTIAQMQPRKKKKNVYTIDRNNAQIFSYNFSLIETEKSLTLVTNSIETKAVQQMFEDELAFNINMFNGIPRPLGINNFGLIRLPLTTATTFRKIVLTSRKANNPITFSNNNNAVAINSANGYNVGGSSLNERNNTGIITKNISNTAALSSSTSVVSNIFNEFSIAISNATTSYLHVLPPQQQRNGTLELLTNPSTYNDILTSTSNVNNLVQRTIFNRHQQSMITNTFNFNSYGSGKKAIRNNSSPVAIVKPTPHLQIAGQTNQTTNNDYSYNNVTNSQNVRTIYFHSSSSLGTDCVKLIKRSPIAKSHSFKPFCTQKIITEMLVGRNSLNANFLGVLNGICDNEAKSYSVDCYRNRNSYAKPNIYKLNQRVRMKNLTLKIVREKKHKLH